MKEKMSGNTLKDKAGAIGLLMLIIIPAIIMMLWINLIPKSLIQFTVFAIAFLFVMGWVLIIATIDWDTPGILESGLENDYGLKKLKNVRASKSFKVDKTKC